MGRFLSDNDYPITLSASAFEPSVKSRVKRAIAEVDGMVAGITFLDKGGQMPVADVVSDIWDLTHGLQDDGQHLFSTETIVPDTPSRLPEATYVAKPRCDDPHRAWTALSELKDGMRRQFDRFCKIASYDNVPEIIRLRDFYTSANAMSDMGLQTYRDVLQGSVPDTLAEVFAFAALSYAISDILLHHGRMREEEILSDRTSEAFGFSQLLSFSNWGENAELKYPVALDASVAMADFDTLDTGDYFFLLSNRGATVTCQKTGSGYASSRSKAERKLRKEFFKPLKKAMASNESFLALLSVAKKFVVVGSLSTLEEVQDYLLALSTQLISPEDHVSFVRWIFNNPGEAEVKQHSPSLNRKRKTPSDGPPKNSVAEKRQKQ
nr:uncharacterized protein CTRU02_08423 [Colletotrichum truncatum]KAF6789724.1 hypothetical protein CTRU02_08423 [Colletotrichum truncatum]